MVFPVGAGFVSVPVALAARVVEAAALHSGGTYGVAHHVAATFRVLRYARQLPEPEAGVGGAAVLLDLFAGGVNPLARYAGVGDWDRNPLFPRTIGILGRLSVGAPTVRV